MNWRRRLQSNWVPITPALSNKTSIHDRHHRDLEPLRRCDISQSLAPSHPHLWAGLLTFIKDSAAWPNYFLSPPSPSPATPLWLGLAWRGRREQSKPHGSLCVTGNGGSSKPLTGERWWEHLWALPGKHTRTVCSQLPDLISVCADDETFKTARLGCHLPTLTRHLEVTDSSMPLFVTMVTVMMVMT